MKSSWSGNALAQEERSLDLIPRGEGISLDGDDVTFVPGKKLFVDFKIDIDTETEALEQVDVSITTFVQSDDNTVIKWQIEILVWIFL